MYLLKKDYLLNITIFIILICFFCIGKLESENLDQEIDDLLKINTWELLSKNLRNSNDLLKININKNENIISNKGNTYSYKSFDIKELPGYDIWKDPYPKPVGYIDSYKDNVIFVSGDGVFLYFNYEETSNNNISTQSIKSNISEIIQDKDFYRPSWISVKDLLIIDNEIYISYTKEVSENCYNISILSSNFSFNSLNFSEFFSYNECVHTKKDVFNAHQSGGKLSYKDEKIIFTTGDFRQMIKAQDPKSVLGKIISISMDGKKFEIISYGHRNPQGLFYDNKSNVIINTEHGPRGGDEININFIENDSKKNKTPNFGWPISSYGEHYDGVYRDYAPLYKSHNEYGYIEPIKYFDPSIGISDIVGINELDIQKNSNTNSFFYGAMGTNIDEGDLSIHHIVFDENYSNILFEDTIIMTDRIRDFEKINHNNQIYILFVLENNSEIGIIKLI